MLDMDVFTVRIGLLEDLLGTVPKNKSVYGSYIAAKGRELMEKEQAKGIPHASGAELNGDGKAATALLEEEVETIQEIEDRGHTGFHEDEDGPFLFDYQFKGFLGESARTLKEHGKGEKKLKQLQDKFKRYVFVHPRRIRLPRPGRVEGFQGKPLLVVTDKGIVCERPLRAQTAQGPRVTVVRSDVILAGAELTCTLRVLSGGGITRGCIEDVLAYGQFIGLGQWRGAGFGRFEVLELAKEG